MEALRVIRTSLVIALVTVGGGCGLVDAAELRIGIVGLDTSHATAFTKAFNAAEPDEDLRGMRVTTASPMGSADIESSTSRRDTITAQVAAQGVEIVDSIDAMLENVDAVLVETNDGRPHLAQVRSVIAARKPVFVDKPVGASLAEVIAIYTLAERVGVPIFSSSALRWGDVPQAVRAGAIGHVRGCDTYGPCMIEPTHPDLFWYGIHGVEMLVTCMGTDCEEVTRIAAQGSDLVVGRWPDGRLGTFRGMRPLKPFGGVAFGDAEHRVLGDNPGYMPLVRQIARFFRTGKPPVPAAETIEIYAIMEAAHESGRRGGVPVKVADVLTSARTEAETMLAADQPELIDSIEKQTLLRGRDGSGPTWFHPRACMVPGAEGPTAFMTLQPILGSDLFGPVHWMTSNDLGRTWTAPEPVPPLGRVPLDDGGEEGVCDVVPEWHPQTSSVLAIGHNVFYKEPRFSKDQPPRWPVYAVWRDGHWGPRRRLEWNDPRGATIFTNGCGQRIVLPDGDVLLALSFAASRQQPRTVATARCRLDGDTLAIRQVGEEIRHEAGRGLLEPSLVRVGGRFLITMRAEDGRGYVATSDDGLAWSPKQAWAWDDGSPLETSTTQQHWLAHAERLFLVYTRKDATNVNVFRWRAPLWMAEVDAESLRLRRDTERVVLPLVGDGVNDPNRVAIMGNFHIVNASSDESWVTVGEWQPKNGIRGDLLLARIHWARKNALVGR